MLENLDKIKWRRLSTSYGSAEDAPKYIRMLLSSDELDQQKATVYMVGAVNHQGDIHDSTIAVVPFLLELLANENTPNRNVILSILNAFTSSLEEKIPRANSLAFFKLLANLHHELEAGRPIYEAFLHHPDRDTRYKTAIILKILGANVARTRLRLWHTFKTEADRHIKHVLLEAIIASLPNDSSTSQRLLQHYQTCFAQLLESESDLFTQYMAAYGWIYCDNHIQISTDTPPPQAIMQALIASFSFSPWELYNIPQSLQWNYFLSLDISTLLDIFSNTHLPVEILHKIARELLRQNFRIINRVNQNAYIHQEDFWELFLPDDRAKKRDSMFYSLGKEQVHPQSNLDFHSNYPASHKRRKIIAAIVNRDEFWELPTNLFSFFFGLPDDRESLRKLLTP